jgi:hypothetical protein
LLRPPTGSRAGDDVVMPAEPVVRASISLALAHGREPTMIDLATITAIVARDRVADQFAGPGVAAAAPKGPLRRTAAGTLRAIADRLEPAPRYAAQT